MLVNLADSLEVDIDQIFTFIQIEDPKRRKALLESLLKKADEEQLKLAVKVLRVVIEKWKNIKGDISETNKFQDTSFLNAHPPQSLALPCFTAVEDLF